MIIGVHALGLISQTETGRGIWRLRSYDCEVRPICSALRIQYLHIY